jgi:hypothetical protein
MIGLGLVVTGVDTAGTINDYRTTPGDVAFLACSGQFNNINLSGNVVGWDLNGQTLQELTFAADIDGDGQFSDLTGLYVGGYVQGNVTVQGAFAGDVWVAGSNAYNWSLKLFSAYGGAFDGDLRAVGKVGLVRSYGTYTHVVDVGPELRYFLVYNGDFSGQVTTTGPMWAFLLDNGSFLTGGSLTVNGIVSSGNPSQSWGVAGDSIHFLILRNGVFAAGANVQAAARIYRTNLPDHQTDNGGTPFGIFAGSFNTFMLGATNYNSSALPFIDGDFQIAVA